MIIGQIRACCVKCDDILICLFISLWHICGILVPCISGLYSHLCLIVHLHCAFISEDLYCIITRNTSAVAARLVAARKPGQSKSDQVRIKFTNPIEINTGSHQNCQENEPAHSLSSAPLLFRFLCSFPPLIYRSDCLRMSFLLSFFCFSLFLLPCCFFLRIPAGCLFLRPPAGCLFLRLPAGCLFLFCLLAGCLFLFCFLAGCLFLRLPARCLFLFCLLAGCLFFCCLLAGCLFFRAGNSLCPGNAFITCADRTSAQSYTAKSAVDFFTRFGLEFRDLFHCSAWQICQLASANNTIFAFRFNICTAVGTIFPSTHLLFLCSLLLLR